MDKTNILNDMICKVCENILFNPYELECCGKLYCYECTLKSNKTCFKCKKFALFRPNSFINRILNQMSFICHFDCKSGSFGYNAIREHLKLCQNKKFRCKLCKNFYGHKKDFVKHLSEEHEDDLITFHENLNISKKGSTDIRIRKGGCVGFDRVINLNDDNLDNINSFQGEEFKESPYIIRPIDFNALMPRNGETSSVESIDESNYL